EYPEPSSTIGFSNNVLVRDSEHRDDDILESALLQKSTRVYLFCEGAIVLKNETQASFDLEEIKQFSPDLNNAIVLGIHENDYRLAAPFKGDAENMPDGYDLIGLRPLLYNSNVNPEDVGAIAQGNSVLFWNAMNQYCGKCGGKTTSAIGGFRRDCAKCESQIFPRTDPVVIMMAVKGDKCLLGRSPHFPENWYSTLAGFVEPGETIENATRRETFEESGIKIGRVKYYASQPWPFQHSLMIGVHCEAIDDTINMDETELEDCRWFTKDEVKLMIEDKHPKEFQCPPNLAIASLLIRAWALD
ncbi:MAG: NAD(+) diphosphatase, partial [Nitratireductor sp.]